MTFIESLKKKKGFRRRLIDSLDYNPETGEFKWKNKRKSCGTVRKDWYIQIRFEKSHLAHRLAWYIFYGVWPIRHIDHIDGNKSNNSIFNLRLANGIQNSSNRRGKKRNKYFPLGVTARKGYKEKPYVAQILYKSKFFFLGGFETIEKAHKAYKKKHIELNGKYSPYHKTKMMKFLESVEEKQKQVTNQ